MALLRILSSLFWAAVFVVILLFAIKNTELVTLRFYFDQVWHAPLVLVVLVAFGFGAALGVAACLPAMLRQRRKILGLGRELALRPRESGAAVPREPVPATAADTTAES